MGGKITPQNKSGFLLDFNFLPPYVLIALSHFPNCVSLMSGSPSHPF